MTANNQKEYIGVGSSKKIKEIAEGFKSDRIFLVTGKKSFGESGAERELKDFLSPKTVHRFYDFDPNPSINDIKRGIEIFKEFSPDLVVAVGGGSVIDMAKAINTLSQEEEVPEEYITGRQKLSGKGLPLIAIPTTSGSGSEATHFAVVYIDKVKYSLAHPAMLPSVAIIDPSFTHSLSSKITAPTGADALCQAIESYWSVQSTEESKGYAKKSLKLAFKNLKDAVLAPTPKSREAMSEAAHLSGKAINISKTTACHAFSYPFTAHLGIAHGHAVALTLGLILVYNSEVQENDVADPRGLLYVKQTMAQILDILGVSSPKEGSDMLNRLFTDIGLTLQVRKIGPIDPASVLKETSIERMKNNPRRMTEQEAKKIVQEIM